MGQDNIAVSLFHIRQQFAQGKEILNNYADPWAGLVEIGAREYNKLFLPCPILPLSLWGWFKTREKFAVFKRNLLTQAKMSEILQFLPYVFVFPLQLGFPKMCGKFTDERDAILEWLQQCACPSLLFLVYFPPQIPWTLTQYLTKQQAPPWIRTDSSLSHN